ncbi:fimbria/pilus periplasmic chaperone [Entomohabitans teleogrylli]|uniref:fimbria/pilus periplasmic chaperone n=1 Tax=Entomohabitans teleogrylli TaxID=1384589 RepID=UPI00073D5588|nr:fimbria/pilus periplasmic chaperone [Entomohabitans teleogrylli]
MLSFRCWLAFNSRPATAALLLAGSLSGGSLWAVVNTEVTRVVFNGDENSVSLALSNSPQQPTLVQLWVDEGDPRVAPDSVKTPLTILPPVFRMEPGELRSVKLLLADRDTLPRDRESLYWLNIYQIPPLTAQDERQQQKVILPLRIRMKLFIRPAGVAPLREQDGGKLTFRFLPRQRQLVIDNPGPWHMTLSGLSCGNYRLDSVMVPPATHLPVTLTGADGPCQTVNYEVVNDSGNRWSYTVPAGSER